LIAWGALSATLCVAAAIVAVRRDSRIERRLAMLLPALGHSSRWRPVSDRDLDQSAVRRTQNEIASAKILGLLTGAAIGGLGGNVVGVGTLGAIACGYGGFILPSVVVERRAESRRRAAERPITMLFERLEALACAGRPVETALAAVSRVATGSPLLDATLRGSVDAYALGAPLFRSLAVRAQDQGLEVLAAFAVELERSRDLGQGSVAVIRDARDAARARRRTRSLETAATVEGKLMLTLVLCYLPALLLLVVIPLFLTLLDGLFG
jgi:Flp pilus assembly protein TadB